MHSKPTSSSTPLDSSYRRQRPPTVPYPTALTLICALCGSGRAEDLKSSTNSVSVASPPAANAGVAARLPEVLVQGRGDSLLQIADSAAQGTVGVKQLETRPLLRAGELLEAVPGVIITQHAGGGKANQYFLRGFNLDHGTDFAVSLDGMPINLPTHAHGQGYTDMNIVIPELTQRVNYQKGVYYAENGDFSSAGAAQLETFKVLPQALAILEGGMYGYARTVFAASPQLGAGHLLYGFEASHYDGPWRNPDDYQKFNGVLAYSQGDDAAGFSITGRGYHGRWDSSDQVAAGTVASGLTPFFGSLDDTTGGNSQRYSLQAEWHRSDAQSATKVMAYGFYYDLDLFSNFTYFLTDTNRGDQFEQADRRVTTGLKASHTLFSQWGSREVENTFGLQARNDDIRNGLFQTEARQRVDKINAGDGSALSATTRQDDILQTSVGLYYENKVQWAEKFRSVAGVRGDIYNFDVRSSRDANSGGRVAAVGSPKVSLVFGPWSRTEIYAQGGLGFHSNDGRGVNTRVDPVTGTPTAADGTPIRRADPLVQTYGAEVGVRTLAARGLQSTLSLWWLDIDSELVFAGDAGATEASRPSRRYGIEWANYYNLTKRLTLDADFSFSRAEFRDSDPIGRHIPGSIETVVSSGISYHSESGLFSSLRLRYFGPRPLIEDNSIRSGATILLGAQLGYRFNKTWTLTAEAFNILNRRDHDIDYAYESRVRPGDSPATQVHYHPVEPIQARFALTARF
ncbi:MAG: TonB-dependent receptor [Verrucomicrobia bacterium]|nr:TonB-dependent receptor [Verrucomicrobiota bacterium]MBI3870089.1 TonB-dependent receptor [Verrucomicrobiota bacterium]